MFLVCQARNWQQAFLVYVCVFVCVYVYQCVCVHVCVLAISVRTAAFD